DALLEQRQRLRPIADVHNRLRSHRSHVSLGPQHSVADREDARLYGPADLAGVRIEAEDGKSRDWSPPLRYLPRCGKQARRDAEREDENASSHNSSRWIGNRIKTLDFVCGGLI